MKNIHIEDVAFKHCECNNPLPPKNFSKYIKWVRDGKGDPQKTVYTDFMLGHCNGGIGWIIEPLELLPHVYEHVKQNHTKFREIWTHERTLIETIPNAKFVPFGGCWIDTKDYGLHPKTKLFSIIASSKHQLEGHKLRHSIVQAGAGNIDLYGGGYKYIHNKIDGLKDYYYHFAIENCKRDYWFTEKLIDCLMTGTIPIYWGCPSIGDFFNTDGFIIFNDLHDLKDKLKNCTPEYYNSKIKAIAENFELAKKYILAEDWIYTNGLVNNIT
jgi:hypothetical protein